MARLFEETQARPVAAQTDLARIGTRASHVHYITVGHAEVRIAPTMDATVTLAGPHTVIGAVSAALAEPQDLAVRTVTPCSVRTLPAERFRHLLAERPTLFLVCIGLAADDYGHLLTLAEDLKLRSAAQRLAGYLLALAGPSGGRGSATLLLPVDKKALTRHLGLPPPSLSRAFRALADQAVTVRGRHVHIADRARLMAFYEGCRS